MNRIWYIDSARGLSVILMVFFNWSFILKFLNIYSIPDNWFYWWLFPRLIGGTFVFIAGVSVVLAFSKTKSYKKILFRGSRISLIGICITLATYIAFPTQTIWFGILHFIGISVLLSTLFLKYKFLRYLFLVFLLAGFFVNNVDFNYLLWLGFWPNNLATFDYWPLIPWFGVFVLGMLVADFILKKVPKYTNFPGLKHVCFLGKHTLIIYLVHQPILIGILLVLGFQVF